MTMAALNGKATATAKVKKVIPPISRPKPQEFGLSFHPDYVWKSGVYVCRHGHKTLFFSSFLPLCQNYDRIEIGDLYNTVAGLVRVLSMHQDGCVAEDFQYIVFNLETKKEEKLLTWEFLSACW